MIMEVSVRIPPLRDHENDGWERRRGLERRVPMGRLVKQGSKGADVRAIQDVLNFHIRRLTALAVDGDFGPLTHARVVEFQKSNQLKPDGIVGPNTMGKLFEEEQLPITLVLVPQQEIDNR